MHPCIYPVGIPVGFPYVDHIRISNFFALSLGIQKVKKVLDGNRCFIVGQTPNAPEELFNN